MEIHFTNRPSRAILVDRRRYQFVIIKTRTGALVPEYGIKIAKQVLDDLVELESRINKDGHKHQFLMLRGIWLDDAHGAVILYVELIHDIGDSPRLSEEDIKNYLHDGFGWYEGQATFVEVRMREAFIHSDHFSPILDEYYDDLESSSFISPEVSAKLISAIVERLGIETVRHLEEFGVASDDTSLEISERLDEIEKKVETVLRDGSKEFSLDFVEGAFKELAEIRQVRLRQANWSFTLALLLAAIGIVVVMAGVILVYWASVSSGTLAAVSGVVLEVVSTLLFRFSKETNDRLDKITEHLNFLDKVRLAMRIAQHINDPDERDKTISRLIDNIRSNA